MQDLAKDVDKSLYGGQGSVRIISNLGVMAASSDDPKEVGQPVKNFFGDKSEEIIRHVQSGDAFVDIDKKTGMMPPDPSHRRFQ